MLNNKITRNKFNLTYMRKIDKKIKKRINKNIYFFSLNC